MTAAANLPMDTRISARRPYTVLVVLLAWLTPFLACPRITVDLAGLASLTPDRTAEARVGQHRHGDADSNICCSVQQPLSTAAQRYNLRTPTFSVFQAAGLVIIASAVALLAVKASDHRFVHSPPLIPRCPPALGALWPHAPPA